MPDLEPIPTQTKIIRAAADIFGKEGYRAATIRKIAKAAEVNVAAINYHFKGKEGLYRSVLEDMFSTGFKRFPSAIDAEKDAPPEQRLQTFIHNMFYRFMSVDGWQGISGQGNLLAREFLDPTPAFGDLLDTYVKPQKEILVSIIRELAVDAGPQKVLACAVSIIGQCIYYTFAGRIIAQIAGDMTPTQDNLSVLAETVFRFSLGGIQAINKLDK